MNPFGEYLKKSPSLEIPFFNILLKILLGISCAPNCNKWSLINCVSIKSKPPHFNLSNKWNNANFEALLTKLNMLSPKKTFPIETPYKPPTNFLSI